MSEFKFACPVCGQHIKCDSSQAGTQMECPTCFQKITVPQAPEGEQKFVLTGTKKGERPLPAAAENAGPITPVSQSKFPGALVVVIILLFIGVAVAFVYHGTIFKSKTTGTGTNAVGKSEGSNGTAATPAKQVAVPPPSSDTNWLLDLTDVTIPETPAAGRIHGEDFLHDRANLSTNGTLTIRSGNKGPVELGLTINFSGARADALAGQTINVTTNAPEAARVTLRWKENNEVKRASFDSGYAMRLEFGPEQNNRIKAKIYLCTPDNEKSYIAGTFTFSVRRR